MPYLNIDGAQIYYESIGEGPAMVLAHGVGGNHAIWFNQLAAFSPNYRVITFDHRGFGNSSDPQQLGRSAYTSDLTRILDHLEVDRVVLVGQSMGGGTCVGFAKCFPERVAALVLADTLHALQLPSEAEKIMQKARADTNGLSQLDRVLGADFRESDAALTALYKQLNSFNATNRHNLKGEYQHHVNTGELAGLGVPVLFIAGEYDVLFPITAIRATQTSVKGSELIEIKNAGHSAFYEKPEVFNQAIESFLQKHTRI
jgi:pimeloyl-ACP methyl ester carboxylesterase